MNYPWQTNVFYPSPDMAQSETYEHKYKLYSVLGILLQVPIVQFGIIFDKRAEIHLDYRKQKIGSKKFETSTQQYVCSLFMYKKLRV